MMLPVVTTFLLSLSSVASGASNVTKREADSGYGAPAPAPNEYGAPAQAAIEYSAPSAGYGAPGLDASFAGISGPSGGKCRAETKYILTWTKIFIPVTEYDTRTQYLPTTLYQYQTATEYYDLTKFEVATTARAIRPGYKMETKISYQTRTVVVPQVESVTSTLLFTDDEHVTVTETDVFTQTQVQQYPVEVTETSVVQVPQIQTSVVTENEVLYQTRYETRRYDVVQTSIKNVPDVRYITSTSTAVEYVTVALTKVQQNYVTVTKCAQQGYNY